MRRRIDVLVAVTTSLVLVAFLVPLALLVRSVAADHATNSATREAESIAPLVATLDRSTLELTLDQLSHDDDSDFPLTVFLPNGTVVGHPAPRSEAVRLAATGRSLTAATEGGREVLIATQGGPQGTTVIRAEVSDDQLTAGVLRTWLVLALLGVALLGLSLLVADQLARRIVAPIERLADATQELAAGDLSVRVRPTGPPEVRHVADGLNLLAGRIGELLTAERESVADLSHRLRTPLTALRLGVDALPSSEERERLVAATSALERSVDRLIQEARRPVREGVGAGSDAAAVVRDRLRFWSALAEDEERVSTIDLPDERVPVATNAVDLEAAVDALLGNVFAHTPEGTNFAVALRRADTHAGPALLEVEDAGPGIPSGQALVRGASEVSTGLGLDIVRRTAVASGGVVQIDRSPRFGGARVRLTLPPPPPGTPLR